MPDWSRPQSLAKVTEEAGFTMSDVSFISGLDESTVSRLWDDPNWLDRVRGSSLQALVACVPGIAEYFATYSVASRRNKLVNQREAEGLRVNRQALSLSAATPIPHQYLINALEAAISIMRGDASRTNSLVARFWGIQQNRALEALYSSSGEQALLINPLELFAASRAMMPRLNRKGYSFHSILTKATFAHHLGIATGEFSEGLQSSITGRQAAFTTRSEVMGIIISSNDLDLAEKYSRTVAATPVLNSIEDWAFPTYARDSRPNVDFSLPGSILLRNTATEIIREMASYSDAYLYYLCTTYLPIALTRDPTLGLHLGNLKTALKSRLKRCDDVKVRTACQHLMRQIEGALP